MTDSTQALGSSKLDNKRPPSPTHGHSKRSSTSSSREMQDVQKYVNKNTAVPEEDPQPPYPGSYPHPHGPQYPPHAESQYPLAQDQTSQPINIGSRLKQKVGDLFGVVAHPTSPASIKCDHHGAIKSLEHLLERMHGQIIQSHAIPSIRKHDQLGKCYRLARGIENDLQKQYDYITRLKQERAQASSHRKLEQEANSTALESMEKARNDQSAQLEQMSLVISKLRKRGLPEAHDDSYYSSAFGDLVADLRRWARLAARGHGPIQGDEIQRLSIATQKLLRSRIFNLEQLIHMGNVSRLRTRVMEVILCSRLVEGPLGGSAQLRMGLSQYQGPLFEFAKHMKFDTDEEAHYWKALTIHALQKNRELMEEQQQNYINATMMELKDDLGALGAPNRTTYDELQQLVLRVVALNVEISQLPYELTLYPCALGLPFTKSFMTDTTAQEDESHLENSKEIVTLVFCRAIAKCWFNEAGMSEASCSAILMKAPVSCEDLSQA